MDEQRLLLDSLMGVNRNHDRKHDVVSDYRDDKVCKFYLSGMCPYDMFTNTKSDLGSCKKVHSLSLKQSFETDAPDRYMYDSSIERDFVNRIADIDRIIKVCVYIDLT